MEGRRAPSAEEESSTTSTIRPLPNTGLPPTSDAPPVIQLPADSPADSRFNWKWSNLIKPFRPRPKTIAAPQRTIHKSKSTTAICTATVTPMKSYTPRYAEARMSVAVHSGEDAYQLARERFHELRQAQSAQDYEDRMRRYPYRDTGLSSASSHERNSVGGSWVASPARGGLGMESAKVALARKRLSCGLEGLGVVAEESDDGVKRQSRAMPFAGVQTSDFAAQVGGLNEEAEQQRYREPSLVALTGEALSPSTLEPESANAAAGSSQADTSSTATTRPRARKSSHITARPLSYASNTSSLSSHKVPNQYTYRPSADPMRNCPARPLINDVLPRERRPSINPVQSRPVSQSLYQAFPNEYGRHRAASQPQSSPYAYRPYEQRVPNQASQSVYQAFPRDFSRLGMAYQPPGSYDVRPDVAARRRSQSIVSGPTVSGPGTELAGSTVEDAPTARQGQAPQPYYFAHNTGVPNLRQSSRGKERALDICYPQRWQRSPDLAPSTASAGVVQPLLPGEPGFPGVCKSEPVQDWTPAYRGAAGNAPSAEPQHDMQTKESRKHKDSVQQGESCVPKLPTEQPPAPESNASTDHSSKSKPSTKQSGVSAEIPSVFSKNEKSGVHTPDTEVSTGKKGPLAAQQKVATWMEEGGHDGLGELGYDYNTYVSSL